jgi:hypothetical protein
MHLTMFQTTHLKTFCLQFLLIFASAERSAFTKTPEYQRLPPLGEQAVIQDAWRDQRISRIPHILQSYGVDA